MGLTQLYPTSERLWRTYTMRTHLEAVFRRKVGQTPYVRRAITAAPAQQRLHAALEIDPSPDGISKPVR